MLCTPKSRVLFLLQSVFCLAACHVEFFHPDNFQFPRTEQDRFIRSRPGLSVVHPEKVDKDGQFVSFSLTHHFSHGQNIRDLVHSEKYVYYRVPFRGLDLTFNLTINRHLLSNEYVLERRLGGSNGTQDRRVSKDNACHLVGSVTHSSFHGTAAMSTCEGLVWICDYLKGFLSKRLLIASGSHDVVTCYYTMATASKLLQACIISPTGPSAKPLSPLLLS